MKADLESIQHILNQLIEPKLNWKIGDLNLLKKVEIQNNTLHIEIALITSDEQQKQAFKNSIIELLAPLKYDNITVTLTKVNVATQGLQNVKNIILIGSGKGGVGKSSIAVNIASLLQKKGFKTGLMDADIYGPSVPLLLGSKERPQVLDDEVLMPVVAHGIKSISIGYLISKEQAVSWRAQLVSGSILQFIRKVNWGELDYLIIDMPPGTGDIQLTIAHELKITGVILVSMPQEIVIGDVLRSLSLYKEKEIQVLGRIDNMTSYQCEQCGHKQSVFSYSNNHDLNTIPTLASLPLDPLFSKSANDGTPFVLQYDNGIIIQEFCKIIEFLDSLNIEN